MRHMIHVAIFVVGCASGVDAQPDPAGTQTNAGSGAGGAPSSVSSGSGAGGTAAVGLGYENGSRLRAMVYVGGDGSRQFNTWFDTQLGQQCAFFATDDGYRCIPNRLPYGLSLSATHFADSSCSARVFVSPAECTVAEGRYFIGSAAVHAPASCSDAGGSNVAFRVGAAISSAYTITNGTCVPSTPSSTPFIWRAEPAPLSTFVRAELEVD